MMNRGRTLAAALIAILALFVLLWRIALFESDDMSEVDISDNPGIEVAQELPAPSPVAPPISNAESTEPPSETPHARVTFADVLRRTGQRSWGIRGRVVDAARSPVPGALVILRSPPELEPVIARCDVSGAFHLESPYHWLTSNPCQLMASDETMRSEWSAVAPLSAYVERETILILDRQTMGIAGTVTTRSGDPLPDAEIAIHDATFPPRKLASFSDSDGRFTIPVERAGRYRLAVQSSDAIFVGRGPEPWRRAEAVVTPEWVEVSENQVTDGVRVVFDGELGATLTVRAVTAGGAAVAGASVSAHAEGMGQTSSGRTNSEGVAVLRSVPRSAAATVSARHVQYGDAESVSVQPGSSSATLVFQPIGAIAGRVVNNDGDPITEFELAVTAGALYGVDGYSAYWSRQPFTAFKHAEGRFSLEGIERDEIGIAVRAAGYGTSYASIARRDADAEITIVLYEEAALSGIVLGPNGEAIAGAKVFLDSDDFGEWIPSMDASASAVSDEAGRFRIGHLEPEEYTAIARAEGFAPARADVTLHQGRDAEVTLRLEAGASIEGLVRNNGQTATASVSLASIMGGDYQEIIAAESGRFRFSGLPAGNYVLGAWNEEGDARAVDVALAPGEVRELTLELAKRGATLEGVVTENGVPVLGGEIECYSLSPDGFGGAAALIEPDGSYVLEGVIGGDCIVRVLAESPRGGRIQIAPGFLVTVEQGGASRFDVDLAECGTIAVRTAGFDPENVRFALEPEYLFGTGMLDGILGLVLSLGGGLDENGLGGLRHVAPGRYAVYLVKPDGDSLFEYVPLDDQPAQMVEVRPGETTEVRFEASN